MRFFQANELWYNSKRRRQSGDTFAEAAHSKPYHEQSKLQNDRKNPHRSRLIALNLFRTGGRGTDMVFRSHAPVSIP